MVPSPTPDPISGHLVEDLALRVPTWRTRTCVPPTSASRNEVAHSWSRALAGPQETLRRPGRFGQSASDQFYDACHSGFFADATALELELGLHPRADLAIVPRRAAPPGTASRV